MSATPQAVSQMTAPPPEAAPPSPSPLNQPEAPKGSEMASKVNVQTAMLLLQHALPSFGLGSREGKALMDVLKKLSIEFGEAVPSKELVPAQIMQLVQAQRSANPVPMPAPPQ